MVGLSRLGAQLKEMRDKLSGLGALASLGGGGSFLGLSIGTSSVKLVELRRTRKLWKMQQFGMAPLPEDAIVNRELVNTVAITDAIGRLVNQLGLKGRPVCASITGPSMIIKRLLVQAPNAKELREQVFWEAEQYLPFDVSEVAMDFQPLSRGPIKDGQHDVLLIAVKRTVLESYMAAISEAGLKPQVIDTDYFALHNLFEVNYPQSGREAVALVEVGASATKFVVVQDGFPIYTKDAAHGGAQLTQDIQRSLNISRADAESLKTGGVAGGLPQEVSELMAAAAENLASELRKMVDYYNSASAGAPLSSMLLTGGGSSLQDLSRLVEEAVGFPAQLLNPFNAIGFDPAVLSPAYVASIAPFASVPLGLALRAGTPAGGSG
jgi:type IV pilus assembly protein PilM